MKRNEFLKQLAVMGIGMPFFLSLSSCGKEELVISDPNFDINFEGKILIIGAGAAGLTAGYLLQRNNIDFEIIEASSVVGGRMKRNENLADFPIDLGAEWIHADPSILAEIISDTSVKADVDFITYNPQSVSIYKNDKVKKYNWVSNFYSEYKFKSTTWFGFFEKYILPDIENRINLNEPVTKIDYSGNKTIVETQNGIIYEADKILVTVPIKMLQREYIQFIPEMPQSKLDAINSIHMGDGLKVFIEFKERFYPDILLFDGLISSLEEDDRMYYNAAFRKDSNRNILGLFTIGDKATPYTSLDSEEAIIEKVMNELDEIFDGKASDNYLNHTVQNWSKEPFIGGSYSTDFENDTETTQNTILEPIDEKIYFAGEAVSISDQATVHGAAQTAYDVVELMLDS